MSIELSQSILILAGDIDSACAQLAKAIAPKTANAVSPINFQIAGCLAIWAR